MPKASTTVKKKRGKKERRRRLVLIAVTITSRSPACTETCCPCCVKSSFRAFARACMCADEFSRGECHRRVLSPVWVHLFRRNTCLACLCVCVCERTRRMESLSYANCSSSSLSLKTVGWAKVLPSWRGYYTLRRDVCVCVCARAGVDASF